MNNYLLTKILRTYSVYCTNYIFEFFAHIDDSTCTYVFSISKECNACSIVDDKAIKKANGYYIIDDGDLLKKTDIDLDKPLCEDDSEITVYLIRDRQMTSTDIPYVKREYLIDNESTIFKHMFETLNKRFSLNLDLSNTTKALLAYWVDKLLILLIDTGDGLKIETCALSHLSDTYKECKIIDFDVAYNLRSPNEIQRRMIMYMQNSGRNYVLPRRKIELHA